MVGAIATIITVVCALWTWMGFGPAGILLATTALAGRTGLRRLWCGSGAKIMVTRNSAVVTPRAILAEGIRSRPTAAVQSDHANGGRR